MAQWKCHKCGRIFGKRRQPHSCTVYPIENHLRDRPSVPLYNSLRTKIRKTLGPFKVESLPCCIHFVVRQTFTFAAVYVMNDRIRIHFRLDRALKSRRIGRSAKVSKNSYSYSIDILSEKEINSELIGWLAEAYGPGPSA